MTLWDPLENESSPKVTVLRIQMNVGAEGKVDWMWTSLNWLKCNPVHLWSKHRLSITPGQQKHSCSWIVSVQPLSSKLVYVVSWFLISGFKFEEVAVLWSNTQYFKLILPVGLQSTHGICVKVTILHKPQSLCFLLTDWRYRYENARWQNRWSSHPHCQELSVQNPQRGHW